MCASFLYKIVFFILMVQILEISTNEPSGPLLKPEFAPRDGEWQPVNGTKLRFFVYSAYLDRRWTPAAVRVIAATRTQNPEAVICRLWLRNNKTVTLNAHIKAIRENFNMAYTASFLYCLLRQTDLKPDDIVGASVSIISKVWARRRPANRLKIRDTLITHKEDISNILHVCVKPFHFSYSRADWLLEWLELHQLLGASHFYMYNASISESVGCLLKQYVKRGLVTLLPWHLPIISKVEIRTEGLFAAFNDCLYRSMSTAGWLMILDVDEVILPRKKPSMIALLSSLRNVKPKRNYKAPGAFLFRNVFFYLRWSNDKKAPAPLVTAQKTRRVIVPEPYQNRSKYVVRPNETIELGNHFPWQMLTDVPVQGVSPETAVLHHYRVGCEDGGNNCLAKPSMIDRTAHYWTNELALRVSVVKKIMTAFCSHVGNHHKYISLNDGNSIPRIAIGTSGFAQEGELSRKTFKDKLTNLTVPSHVVTLLQEAADTGYNHFVVEPNDQERLGRTLYFINLNRPDIFLTTKASGFKVPDVNVSN